MHPTITPSSPFARIALPLQTLISLGPAGAGIDIDLALQYP